MATHPGRPKLIAIVGPTASGKSGLALKLAKKYSGEIIAADSRTLYRGADIGTSKPTKKEQKTVPYWGLDLIAPGQAYSAKTFKDYAQTKIKEILSRGGLPILVGGTGLYIDAVLFDFDFRPTGGKANHAKMEAKTVPQLQSMIIKLGYKMPQNSQNKRHLVRTIETAGALSKKRLSPIPGSLIVGLMPPPNELKGRIRQQAIEMYERGVVNETKKIARKYGLAKTKDLGIIYKVCCDLLTGKLSQEEAMKRTVALHWQYSRRQRTWLKRNKFVRWFDNPDSAWDYLQAKLNT